MARPSWDEYFIGIIEQVRQRGTCDRGKAGCIIVKDKRILTTGYAGPPQGTPHCDEAGHQMRTVIDELEHLSKHCVRTIHAEQNAIIQAAKYGISIDGAIIYATMVPCYACAKMLVAAGIKRAVCVKDYHASQDTKKLFKQAGLELIIKDVDIEKYSNQ